MEFLSLCLVSLTTVLVIWFLKITIKGTSGGKKNPNKQLLLPPGPWRLPIIGSLHHVASVIPYRRMMELSRRHGPLMHLMLGEVPAVIVSSAEVAALVMKTNDPVFASRPSTKTLNISSCGGQSLAFAPYGDHWRQMRKIVIIELLSMKQVKRLDDVRTKEVGNLIAKFTASTGAINISDTVLEFSNDVISLAVFGGKFDKQQEYIRVMVEVFELAAGFSLVDLFPSSKLVQWLSSDERKMRRAYGRIQQIVSDITDERKAGHAPRTTDGEDLLDVLLRLQKDDSLEIPLTTEIIGAVLSDIFAGGTDTSANVLEWAMSELIRHPAAMAKAQLEIREMLGQHKDIIGHENLGQLQYMKMVIMEVLRLHPPAPLIPRMTREDCKVMGYDVLKGTSVYINNFAISRDRMYWKDPEDFKPERFENIGTDYNMTYFEFLPFGNGRRSCPGIQFGMSTVQIVLANFLYHFDWKLPDGASLDSLDMTEKFGLTVSRRSALHLEAIPHVWSNVLSSK